MVFEIPHGEEWDRIVRLRPFVSYVGERAKFRGDVVRVQGQPPVEPYTIDRALTASQEEIFHYLGAGIEAEVLLTSGKTTALSLFGQVSFLWNVGSGSGNVSDPNGNATFYYTADDFTIRPGVGLRLIWWSGL